MHEYGGGSFAIAGEDVVFSAAEGPVYKVERQVDGAWGSPAQISPGKLQPLAQLARAHIVLECRERRASLRGLCAAPDRPFPHRGDSGGPHCRRALCGRQLARLARLGFEDAAPDRLGHGFLLVAALVSLWLLVRPPLGPLNAH